MRACVSARTRARGSVLTIHHMGTADADILSTQRFKAVSLLRNDVHLEDLMHLIILANQATITVRGLGLCCCISCYVCDVCVLLMLLCLSVCLSVCLSLYVVCLSVCLSRRGFIVDGSIKCCWGPERQF